ncbi:hypothetical protein PIB30_010377 [Stylosanthes scabra]|uniref:Uncharacterized protein n=1 Tax=Stylosanthes scabra TaxID=79078 RepID=A0ABU6W641_9FABA|nr:hypothetical protein [Stylosanthes scabra]
MADGKFAWAPSSGILLSGIEENGDGYRPHFEDANLDIDEGSGDSEEDIDAISKIASASETRSTIVNTLVVPGTSIGEMMAEIQNIEAITNDADLHARCCQLMMFKPAREMFVTLKAHEQRLLDWLKFAAYNPLPFNQN